MRSSLASSREAKWQSIDVAVSTAIAATTQRGFFGYVRGLAERGLSLSAVAKKAKSDGWQLVRVHELPASGVLTDTDTNIDSVGAHAVT